MMVILYQDGAEVLVWRPDLDKENPVWPWAKGTVLCEHNGAYAILFEDGTKGIFTPALMQIPMLVKGGQCSAKS